mmetsp:Transcript_13502/g.31767  ORF Transcript_13502/g.31767 Transcript_13502/m.31767 type:complete len:431 (-) Transcript_13502:16-1308(-)
MEAVNGTVDIAWQSHLDSAKRKIRSKLSLEDWQKYGFATARAAEFERLAQAGDDPQGFVARVPCNSTTPQAFHQSFEQHPVHGGVPCIIEGLPTGDQGQTYSKTWQWDNFCQRFAKATFKVGKDDSGSAVRVRTDLFAAYAANQLDDSPVYLFDNRFGGQGCLLKEYLVPPQFPDDYMALAGEESRPPYRWMALGPKRSGTVMHQDPLNTSAWNTLMCGRKRWLVFPPGTPRHIAKATSVMKSDDDNEAINHFLDLLPRLREKGVRPVEFVQYPGDTVFIPGGWWHCVVNLDDTVAVTQNYCGRCNFARVWRSTREERPCWSHKWLAAMRQKAPKLADRAIEMNKQDDVDMQQSLVRNRERRIRRRQRREDREVRRKRAKTGAAFDEAAFRQEYREQAASSSSDSSTVSTTSSSSYASSTSTDSDDTSGD